jgi:hypothetical protein
MGKWPQKKRKTTKTTSKMREPVILDCQIPPLESAGYLQHPTMSYSDHP